MTKVSNFKLPMDSIQSHVYSWSLYHHIRKQQACKQQRGRAYVRDLAGTEPAGDQGDIVYAFERHCVASMYEVLVVASMYCFFFFF
jgi:hypothetical protein